MSEVHRGSVHEHLDIRGAVTVSGQALNGATVRASASLDVKGQLIGGVRVQEGARCTVAGQCDGNVYVEANAYLDVTGMLLGHLRQNDGAVTVAVGAYVGRRVVSPDGVLVEPPPGGVTTNASAQRFEVIGTWPSVALAPLGRH